MSNQDKNCIVGAGLVGSLLSLMMAKRGHEVDVYERRPDIRKASLVGGRSINLALSNRGLRALHLVGLEEEVKQLCIPMYGREVHDLEGNTSFYYYGKPEEAINSVSRGGLNQLLLEKAGAYPNISFHFNHRCDEANLINGDVSFTDTSTNDSVKKHYDVIFGTDGAFSAIRQAMMKTDMLDFEYKQSYIPHAYKELTIPVGANGSWQINKDALHIWPRKSFMIIALPNLDGSFTCTLFLSKKGEVSFEALNTEKELEAFFKTYFKDLIPLIPNYVEDFFHNPTSSLVTITCSPWHIGASTLLLGDAAHPIVPFYGQGMNAGFEDCTYLSHLMDEYNTNWSLIFDKFNQNRKPNGDAVGQLALRNFIEMRDLVADPEFILKNKIDKLMESNFPDKWTTLYRMVTFAETPYQDAWNLGLEHDSILKRIVSEHPDIEQELNSDKLKLILKEYV